MPVGPGQTLSHYRLVERIGKGGMGEVYVAEDTTLDRRVALKVLPPELAAHPERLGRFQREARALAALNHPNIVTIHTVEEAEGVHFLTMEMVEGQVLSRLIPADGMPLSQLFDIAIPLTDALAAAHEQGITHRDLKPDNVMVTPQGRVKVLDFGLAKQDGQHLDGGAGSQVLTATVTQEGKIVGTVAYMSPEQIEGQAVDPRSDVFSLGILLYEMALGERPFQGESPISTLSSILKDPAPAIDERKPELPRHLGRIVQRCLAKERERRYQTMLDIQNELTALRKEIDSGELERPAAVVRAPKPFSMRLLVGALALIGVLAVFGVLVLPRLGDGETAPAAAQVNARNKTIGVIGFENLSDPQDSENIGRMLMSLITTHLTESGGLQVASTPKVLSALRQVSGGSTSGFDASLATDVARSAAIGTMLVGQVARVGDQLMLTVELTDVEGGHNLGSIRKEAASSAELLALAQAIAEEVRAQLGAATGAGDGTALDLTQVLTGSSEAYRHYAAGEVLLHRHEYEASAQHFRLALDEDPTFALASYRLAVASWWNDDVAVAGAVLNTGLAHIDRLPERWQVTYRAFANYMEGRQQEAYRALSDLIASGVELPDAYYLLGEIVTHSSRFYDPLRARELFEKAVEIDPTFEVVLFHLFQLYILGEDWEAAEARLARHRRGSDSALVSEELWLRTAQRRYDEALALAERSRGHQAWRDHVYAYYAAGEESRALELIERVSHEITGGVRVNALESYAALLVSRGKLLQALEVLQEAVDLAAQETSRVVLEEQVTVYLFRAQLLATIGRFEEALDTMATARAHSPFRGLLYLWEGRFLIRAGRVDDARALLTEFQETAKRAVSPGITFWIDMLKAEVYLADRNPGSARDRVLTAGGMPREYRDPRTSAGIRGRFAEMRHDAPGAVDAYRDVVELPFGPFDDEPGFAVITRTLGLSDLARAETRAGNIDAARKHYTEFLDRWGTTDLPIPEVEQARQNLAAL